MVTATAWHVVHQLIPEEIVPGKRLGRHYKYDSRNALYPYRLTHEGATADQLWDRLIPILDQGDVGSCTGNAQTGVLGTQPFTPTLPAGLVLDEAFALRDYSGAEDIDGDGPFPPNDNGSSGQSAAQWTLNSKLISGYTHASSAADMADALQKGPVIVGVNWYSSFDSPSSSGLISVSKGAYVRGGHEFLVRGCKITDRLFLADNSWGTGYGNAGSMEFSWDTMDRLFSEQGDCTVSIPLTAPAPVPVPVPAETPDQALWDVAGPWCAEHRIRPDLKHLKASLETWKTAKGF